MSDLERPMLRDILVSHYDRLRMQLSRRLGSDLIAQETLQDTYMRLHRGGDIAVLRPTAYLFRMALNVAADNRRSAARAARAAEIDNLVLEVADDNPDALRAFAAKQEVLMLEHAIGELTARRRHVLLAARVRGLTLKQIAAELDVSQRLVELELKFAVQHCAERLGRPIVQRFGPRPATTS